jgi:hypothetical protein
MAVSVASSPIDFPGGIRLTGGTVSFDASYPTGGEAVTPAQWGATAVGLDGRQPDFVLLQQTSPTTTGNVYAWSKATGKIVATWTGAVVSTALAEVTNTTSLATVVVSFLAIWVNPGATVTTV